MRILKSRNAPKRPGEPHGRQKARRRSAVVDLNLGDAMDMEWLGNLEACANRSAKEQLIMVAPQMQEPEVWSSTVYHAVPLIAVARQSRVKPKCMSLNLPVTSQHIN